MASDETLIIRAQCALGVITNDPEISKWLEDNDPQALKQATASFDELHTRTNHLPKEVWKEARAR